MSDTPTPEQTARIDALLSGNHHGDVSSRVSDERRYGTTQGPWWAQSYTENGQLCWGVRCADYWLSVDCGSEANARLIAAAPDLLTGCGSAAWVFGNIHNHRDQQFVEFAKAAEVDVRAAIAKATGRQL